MKDEFTQSNISLTPFGALKAHSLSIMSPILDASWNATIDTIISDRKFCHELKLLVGPTKYKKVIHLIGRKKHK